VSKEIVNFFLKFQDGQSRATIIGHAMYEAAFADGGFVTIIFSRTDARPDNAPDADAGAAQKRAPLGITAELQELRDIAGALQDGGTAKLTVDTDGTDTYSIEDTNADADAPDTSTPQVERTQNVDIQRTQNIHIPASLLKGASPIFASMLEQGWKESTERCIRIQEFHCDDFCVFLDCLYALANSTLLPKIEAVLFDNPKLLRQVLPIVHYYEVDAMKKAIFDKVLCPESLLNKPVVEVANLVLAFEASLPDEAVPDWPTAVLHGLNLYFKCPLRDNQSSTACIEALSLKTLRNMLAASRSDQFWDYFLHRLQWNDLLKPKTAEEASFKQSPSGPQYTENRYSNSGKTVMGQITVDVPWKNNLRSVLRTERERAAGLPLSQLQVT
jgi:hypothetical protein